MAKASSVQRSYVFIVGTGGCGSSVLSRILASHPQVGFVSSTDGLPVLPGAGRFGRFPATGWWTRRLFDAFPDGISVGGFRLDVGPGEAYSAIAREVSPILADPSRDLIAEDAAPWLTQRLATFFDSRYDAQRRSLFMHKFTGWPRAGLIHAVFPSARIIHVVRDGRAVAASLVGKRFWKGRLGVPGWGFGVLADEDERAWEAAAYSFGVLAGLEWKVLMNAANEAQSRVPADQWMDIRFEDLVSDSRSSVRRILEFCGLRWESGFERHFQEFLLDGSRIGAYESALPQRDILVLTQMLGVRLQQYGYSVDGS